MDTVKLIARAASIMEQYLEGAITIDEANLRYAEMFFEIEKFKFDSQKG